MFPWDGSMGRNTSTPDQSPIPRFVFVVSQPSTCRRPECGIISGMCAFCDLRFPFSKACPFITSSWIYADFL